MPKFMICKAIDPFDPDRPYYIDGSDYEGFNQLEAATIAAILNEAREELDWDTITTDHRWLMVEAIQGVQTLQAENERLRDGLELIAAGGKRTPGDERIPVAAADVARAVLAKAGDVL